MGATYFFRDLHTLNMVHSVIIPEINNNRKSQGCPQKKINIWSAGCANGSEPYTLAVILREALDESVFSDVCIRATDIDPNNRFEAIINRGSYTAGELSKIPADMFAGNFMPDIENAGNYVINDNIRKQVKYHHHDLLTLKPVINEPFDIILCKNVLLHFSEKQRSDVIEMFYNSLTDGGFFITEQTQKIPEHLPVKFEQMVSNARIYRKKRF
ncbi:CheR family methyltransferase [Methanoplanus limicola]|uniref:MCP methyltransferase, CheR-type n=1 Tax=Methanoplanus limicola DSM 2279 TaxID=937775 RepID=H1YX91_9EURY|nr:CheR family methyltransferase [Methanoplanus limicola]EHQ35894.1 MCP methyltransferase, CheR-type [Methanoplanus limicola DSM 2279]